MEHRDVCLLADVDDLKGHRIEIHVVSAVARAAIIKNVPWRQEEGIRASVVELRDRQTYSVAAEE